MRSFILGTDWWSDCDDIIALRILARAHKAGQIKLKGIGINACMKYSVASVEGFLNTEEVYDIPLGIDFEATDFGGCTVYQEGLATLSSKHKSNEDAVDAVRLYRKILAESEEPVEILEIGYPQVLAAVINSGADDISEKTGFELFKEKVPKVWIMAGRWDEENGKENNFCRNERSRVGGELFCRTCPVPVTFLGFEVGYDVLTATNIKENDVLYPVLCRYNSEKVGRASWDPMLCLMAIIGDEAEAGYDSVSGTASLNSKTGENTFIPSEDGMHKYVIKKMENEYYVNKINELIG